MSGILLASVGASYSAAPVNTVAPAVTGTASFGFTLTTTNGTWTGAPAPTFSYQWQRVTTNISGATSSTYVLVAADVGNTIRCVVTATNIIAAVSANSNSTAAVAAVVPGAPTIGTATQTGATTATVTYTAPASDGGATITLYTATSSPAGGSGTLATAGSGTINVTGLTTNTSYTFTVTATNSAGTSAPSAASNSVTPVEPYWMRTLGATGYNTDGFSITANSAGAVYQVGFVNSPGGSGAFVGKYSAAGAVTFQERFKKVGDGDPTFYAVEMASDGGFYASGQISIPSTGGEIGVVKFDSSGNISWQKAIVGTGSFNENAGNQLAVDGSDNVYVPGFSPESGSFRGVFAKWDSSGTLQYQKQFTGGGGTSSFILGIAVAGNNLYLAGYGGGFASGAVQATLVKYNQSGNSITWQKILGGANTDDFVSCQVDGSENVYVLGSTDTNLGIMSFLIAKYNSSGTLQWQRKLGTGSTNQTRPGQLALDSSNNVYVVGSNAGDKVQIAKYDSSGAIQWQRSISNTSGGVSRAMTGRDIFIQGDVMYITGDVNEVTGGSPITTIKLPTDGSLTGTYTVGIFTLVYAASSITDEAGVLTEATPTFSVSNTSFTDTTLAYSVFATSLTGDVTPVP